VGVPVQGNFTQVDPNRWSLAERLAERFYIPRQLLGAIFHDIMLFFEQINGAQFRGDIKIRVWSTLSGSREHMLQRRITEHFYYDLGFRRDVELWQIARELENGMRNREIRHERWMDYKRIVEDTGAIVKWMSPSLLHDIFGELQRNGMQFSLQPQTTVWICGYPVRIT